MAQNGPHGHQVIDAAASADGHIAPPTTAACFSSLTSAGGSSASAGNKETMDAGAGMGKNLIPDLNMEHRDSAGDISKDKSPSEAVAVEVAAADAGKGKRVAAADGGGNLSVNIVLERERRNRMKGLFRELQDMMPHLPHKTDKVTLVGEAIQYIKALEEKEAMLRMQTLARKAGAARGEASSSSFSLTAMPQTAQGMAALLCSSDAPRGSRSGGVPAAAPAPAVAAASRPMAFKTWSGSNVVLTVANDNAYISVLAPRRRNSLTTIMSVLHNHGIDVITAQISSDNVRALIIIFTHVTGIDGGNRSSEQVYQRAVSEIMFRLNSNN